MQFIKANELFQAIDEMNSEKFVSFITENGTFIFGNSPEVIGRDNIYSAVDGFFKSIKSIRHYDLQSISVDGRFVVYGTSQYTRHDGTILTTPFCNVFELEGDLISKYQIYIDLSQLYN